MAPTNGEVEETGLISFLRKAVVLCCFVFAAILFAGSTPVSRRAHLGEQHHDHNTSGSAPAVTGYEEQLQFRSIEAVRIGDRVAGTNPFREQAEGIEPDPEAWRKISLHMPKENGPSLWIELLRPLEWIESNGVEPGKQIILSMPEMGAVGDAEVTYLGPCPPIKPGKGAVVTGKFTHQADANSNVVRLRLEGQREATGVTDNHPYWSQDREQFVEVRSLRIGESVSTKFGLRRVGSITAYSDYNGLLYNIETTEHIYRVGSLGTLVHNSCFNRGGSFGSLNGLRVAGKQVAHHVPQNAAHIVSKGRGPALGMTKADHALTRTFTGRGRVTKAAEAGFTPMQRVQKDVEDIRTLFGNKYEKGIQEMLAYLTTLPEFH